VAQVLAEAPDDSYDLVLLDVDNGPGYLVHEGNAAIYRTPILEVARRVVREVLVVWSATEAPRLQEAMTQVFGACEAKSYAVRLGERDEQYWLYVSRA
jgi:hypothetical protein